MLDFKICLKIFDKTSTQVLIYTYRPANITNFVNGTCDLFDVMYEQHHRTSLQQFLSGTKHGDVDGTCERCLTGCVISDTLKTVVFYLCSEWVRYSRKDWLASPGVWVTRGQPPHLGSDLTPTWSSGTRQGGTCARRMGARPGTVAWSEQRCRKE